MRRPVMWVGMMRTNSSRSPAGHGSTPASMAASRSASVTWWAGPWISTLQRLHVHVALEIEANLRVGGLGNRQVHGPRAGEFDIGARGIEMRIVGHHVSGPAHHREQDALGRAALVRRDHVPEPGQLVDHALHAEETLAARV